ncbi:MAG: molybdopterin molybdotransferase MoeA [Proteobacteria bacterium]|nr:molybdopterin molybdotransferase MoeA [Pseudomonadota bacterium]
MIPVAQARRRILDGFAALPAEQVAISQADGRVLAEDVAARVTKPPQDVSSMDGYAVHAADVASVPAALIVVGEAPAGGAYGMALGRGEAVRIFTGGPLPEGADAVVIQENTVRDGDRVIVRESVAPGRFVRRKGLDFRAGDIGCAAGTRLGARQIGLIAAMNVPWVMVTRRPRIAILGTGDEIVNPGDPLGPNQIISSNSLAVAAIVREAGAEALNLGIATDNEASLRRMIAGARQADLLVVSGGMSVGDHDLVRHVLGDDGLALDFWKIAMRPGKPLTFGRLGDTPMLGLPGNPVSTLVCGHLFLRPAIGRMLGLRDDGDGEDRAVLGIDLKANDEREDYLRARLERGEDGGWVATPFAAQDSSMLATLAQAGALVVREPHAPAARAGETCRIVRL